MFLHKKRFLSQFYLKKESPVIFTYSASSAVSVVSAFSSAVSSALSALCCILVVKAPPDEIQGNHDCDLIVTEDAARFSDRAHLAVKLLAACAQPVFIFGFDPEVKDPIHDIQRKI